MIDKSKIALITTVANFQLYEKTATLFPKDIDYFVIDGTTGMFGINSLRFMFEKFKKYKYEWLIMADEDVFFSDSDEVFSMIAFMKQNDYTISGVRDGGVVKHRYHNPVVINTFFSIINIEKLKNINFNDVLKHQVFNESLYGGDFVGLKYDFDIKSLKEPYYCFYFWALLNNYKILYLDAINPVEGDEIANIVLTPNGRQLLLHSWYARNYNVYESQTNRINNYLKKFGISDSRVDLSKIKIFKFPFYNWKKTLKKMLKSIK